MLEQRDFIMIADIMNQALNPIKDDVHIIKQDISGMHQDIKGLQAEVAKIGPMQEDIKKLWTEVSKIGPMQKDIADMKSEMNTMKQDISGLKQEVAGIKSEMSSMEQNISDMRQDILEINLKLENNIDHKINILVEGYGSLNDKMDTMLEEQQRQNKRQDFFDLQLKGHSVRINHITSVIEHLPCQHSL